MDENPNKTFHPRPLKSSGSALPIVRNQQVLGSSPSAGSNQNQVLTAVATSGLIVLGCGLVGFLFEIGRTHPEVEHRPAPGPLKSHEFTEFHHSSLAA